MGLITHNAAVTPAEAEHGHRRTYTLDTLEQVAVAAGLQVAPALGSSSRRWQTSSGTDRYRRTLSPAEYLEGCYKLGQQYPDLCSSIFLMCERGLRNDVFGELAPTWTKGLPLRRKPCVVKLLLDARMVRNSSHASHQRANRRPVGQDDHVLGHVSGVRQHQARVRVVRTIGLHVVAAGPEIFPRENVLRVQDFDDSSRVTGIWIHCNDDVLEVVALGFVVLKHAGREWGASRSR